MMNFKPTKDWQTTSAQFSEILDRTMKAARDADPRRPYLGGSVVGRPCEREIAYQFHGTPMDQGKTGFSGQLYRIFDRGHKGEERVASYIRLAGFDLATEKQDGGQFGFYAMGGKFRGHIDGIVLGGPLPLPYPMLWENKILNNKSWNDTFDNGVKASKPVYYTQMQIYMAYMELDNALFTAENADSCEIFSEVVPFDADHAQAMSDRAVRIVCSSSPEELARCAREPEDYRCRMCDFAKRCWKEPERPAAPKPAWLR